MGLDEGSHIVWTADQPLLLGGGKSNSTTESRCYDSVSCVRIRGYFEWELPLLFDSDQEGPLLSSFV